MGKGGTGKAEDAKLQDAGISLKIAVKMPADKHGFRPALWAARAESIPPDSPRWQLEGKAKVTEYLGRRCLSLQDGAAAPKDFEMADGVIDVDMAGSGARGFYNIHSAHKQTATASRFICGHIKRVWTTPSNIRRP